MRWFALQFLLLVLALASCRTGEEFANTNSSDSPASQTAGGQLAVRKSCLNLNAATTEELGRLPGIGQVTARKIIEYREQNGSFRRPEEIIIIQGFSERKYRSIADLVCVN